LWDTRFVGEPEAAPLRDFRVLMASSERVDTVANAIRNRISDAASQLDPALPGMVVIHFREQIDWSSLPSPNGIELLATRAFQRSRGKSVGALVFSSEPALAGGGDFVSTGAPAYTFEHPEATRPVPSLLLDTFRS